MADISNLLTVREEEEKEEFVFESERAVFFCFPKTLTEDQLKEVEGVVSEFLDKNNQGEGFIIYTLGYGNACKVIENLVNKSKAFYKVEKIKWEDAKKGRKPLFDALRNALKKSEVVFYIDDNLFSTKWLKRKITEDCVEYRLRLMVRRLVNKGEEDLAFIQTRINGLVKRIQEAADAYFKDRRPLMTDEAYDRLKHDLRELKADFPDLGE